MAATPNSKRARPTVIDLTSDDEDVKRPRTTVDADLAPPPPCEAIVQAAAAGDATRLEELLQTFEDNLTEAMMAAAANGHYDCVVLLRDALCEPDDDEKLLDIPGRELISEAVIPAARNGHAEVVDFLLYALECDGEINEELFWAAFHVGAARGYLDIVKLTAEQLISSEEFDRECTPALIKAIDGGHAEVVTFLLGLEDFHCDFGSAFVEAMNKEQHEVAERIYELYSELDEGENLFVEMAGRGRRDAVEYMHSRGHIDSQLISKAHTQATANNCPSVVSFLVGTGQTSLEGDTETPQ
ncbi:hypothetical protein PHYSODRAFT_360665 [Phytophthora sojae]|uniref:Uncharacterized protein n=1 Tax=Phytophthora sojae (strain P6497) TaxID=1094619 RepID=G4ZGB8_PHYSP|nr:hypothetical protein PHYSODRAFT_360665 [Phytophthora sojae]EGZ18563.1 hypothetical protein PHYSODRAFT_360665 [Phytophthora sojae]|eukprot:XP_009527621.1 hypothetical protein PHYSODRAFT_360665 [Phytophthora sojae]